MDLFKWNVANMRLKQRHVEIYGFAATDKNWTEDANNRYLHRLRQLHTRARMQTSDSEVPFATDFKPGGTCQVVTGDWQSRVMKTGSDPMGRWSYFQLDGKKKKNLMITTAYRVSQHSSGGPNTAYTQQRATLLQQGITTQPRQQFILDLIDQVNEWSAAGTPSIVMLDANECIGDETDGLSKLLRKTKLVDLHAHFHDIEHEPHTHKAGSKRIDYILVSPELLDYFKAAGIEPFDLLIDSDHRSLFADFLLARYLDGKPAIQNPTARLLNTKNIREVLKYKKWLHDHILLNKMDRRGDRLAAIPPSEWQEQHQQLYESLDHFISEARRLSEQKNCKPKQYDWSPELQQVYDENDVWNKALRQSKRYSKPNKSLVHLAKKARITLPTPFSERICQHHLREIQKYRKELEAKAPQLRTEFLQRKAAAIAIVETKQQSSVYTQLDR